MQGASANVAGAGVSWGLYFFLLVRHLMLCIINLINIIGCRYNAFKFHLQRGDTSFALKPTSHLMCASIAGEVTIIKIYFIKKVCTMSCFNRHDDIVSD